MLEEDVMNIMGGMEHAGGVKLNDHKRKLKNRFEICRKLGSGTYGKVQLGINKETGQQVAIKTIKKSKIETEADLIRIRREIQIMSSVQHPNIIHIYEVFENKEKMVLVMEIAAGGELYDYLQDRKRLEENEARRIFRQIACAVYYCHKNNICHRDLKLENILLDENGNAKIADFGLSNIYDGKNLLRTYCGSPLYASPEIVKGTPYAGPEVDCWSLGVLLYTLVYGAMPFDGSNFKRLVKQITTGDYYEPKNPSAASGLVRTMLTVSAEERANIGDICSHWWINESYPQTCLEEAEYLASLTPVRLDILLSLAPSSREDSEQVPATPATPSLPNEEAMSIVELPSVPPSDENHNEASVTKKAPEKGKRKLSETPSMVDPDLVTSKKSTRKSITPVPTTPVPMEINDNAVYERQASPHSRSGRSTPKVVRKKKDGTKTPVLEAVASPTPEQPHLVPEMTPEIQRKPPKPKQKPGEDDSSEASGTAASSKPVKKRLSRKDRNVKTPDPSLEDEHVRHIPAERPMTPRQARAPSPEDRPLVVPLPPPRVQDIPLPPVRGESLERPPPALPPRPPPVQPHQPPNEPAEVSKEAAKQQREEMMFKKQLESTISPDKVKVVLLNQDLDEVKPLELTLPALAQAREGVRNSGHFTSIIQVSKPVTNEAKLPDPVKITAPAAAPEPQLTSISRQEQAQDINEDKVKSVKSAVKTSVEKSANHEVIEEPAATKAEQIESHTTQEGQRKKNELGNVPVQEFPKQEQQQQEKLQHIEITSTQQKQEPTDNVAKATATSHATATKVAAVEIDNQAFINQQIEPFEEVTANDNDASLQHNKNNDENARSLINSLPKPFKAKPNEEILVEENGGDHDKASIPAASSEPPKPIESPKMAASPSTQSVSSTPPQSDSPQTVPQLHLLQRPEKNRDSKVIKAAAYWNNYIGEVMDKKKPPENVKSLEKPKKIVSAGVGQKGYNDLKFAFESKYSSGSSNKSSNEEVPPASNNSLSNSSTSSMGMQRRNSRKLPVEGCHPGLKVSDAKSAFEQKTQQPPTPVIFRRNSAVTGDKSAAAGAGKESDVLISSGPNYIKKKVPEFPPPPISRTPFGANRRPGALSPTTVGPTLQQQEDQPPQQQQAPLRKAKQNSQNGVKEQEKAVNQTIPIQVKEEKAVTILSQEPILNGDVKAHVPPAAKPLQNNAEKPNIAKQPQASEPVEKAPTLPPRQEKEKPILKSENVSQPVAASQLKEKPAQLEKKENTTHQPLKIPLNKETEVSKHESVSKPVEAESIPKKESKENKLTIKLSISEDEKTSNQSKKLDDKPKAAEPEAVATTPSPVKKPISKAEVSSSAEPAIAKSIPIVKEEAKKLEPVEPVSVKKIPIAKEAKPEPEPFMELKDFKTSVTEETSSTTSSKPHRIIPIQIEEGDKELQREHHIPIQIEDKASYTRPSSSIGDEYAESRDGFSTNSLSRRRFGSRKKRSSFAYSDSSLTGEEEVTNMAAAALQKYTSIGKHGTEPMYRLRKTKPPFAALKSDSFSSGEEEEDDFDDDGLRQMTAENLFSTLLTRVKSLTRKIHDDEHNFSQSNKIINHRLNPGQTHARLERSALRSSLKRTNSNTPSALSRQSSSLRGDEFESSFDNDGSSSLRSHGSLGGLSPSAAEALTAAARSSNQRGTSETDHHSTLFSNAASMRTEGKIDHEPKAKSNTDCSAEDLSSSVSVTSKQRLRPGYLPPPSHLENSATCNAAENLATCDTRIENALSESSSMRNVVYPRLNYSSTSLASGASNTDLLETISEKQIKPKKAAGSTRLSVQDNLSPTRNSLVMAETPKSPYKLVQMKRLSVGLDLGSDLDSSSSGYATSSRKEGSRTSTSQHQSMRQPSSSSSRKGTAMDHFRKISSEMQLMEQDILSRLRREAAERANDLEELSNGLSSPIDPDFFSDDTTSERIRKRSYLTRLDEDDNYLTRSIRDRDAPRHVTRRSISRELHDYNPSWSTSSPIDFSRSSRERSLGRDLEPILDVERRLSNRRSESLSRPSLASQGRSLTQSELGSGSGSSATRRLSSGLRSPLTLPDDDYYMSRSNSSSKYTPMTTTSSSLLDDRNRTDWRRVSVPERGKDFKSLSKKYNRYSSVLEDTGGNDDRFYTATAYTKTNPYEVSNRTYQRSNSQNRVLSPTFNLSNNMSSNIYATLSRRPERLQRHSALGSESSAGTGIRLDNYVTLHRRRSDLLSPTSSTSSMLSTLSPSATRQFSREGSVTPRFSHSCSNASIVSESANATHSSSNNND